MHQELLITDPEYQARMQAFDQLAGEMAMVSAMHMEAGTYKVPVVVHVMGSGDDLTAITDEQIRNAIKAVNERYRKVPGSSGDGSGVDAGIEFVLAVRDPQGNCTNGITRNDLTWNSAYVANGVGGGGGMDELEMKAQARWDPNRYYNIWAINKTTFNAAGWAYFSATHGQPIDGTGIRTNYLRDPESPVLAHELGHALNLFHTFEFDTGGICPVNNDCTMDGDRVCDTPPHIRSNLNCDPNGINNCDGGSSNSLFVHNYMDYSSASCQNMFTNGQAARMVLALTTDRASFLMENGNTALLPPAFSGGNITTSTSFICGIGQSVSLAFNSPCLPTTFLTDSQFDGIDYEWTLTNGVVTHTSDQQNPTWTLNSPGLYTATVEITTPEGTIVRTEQGIVGVGATPVAACTPSSNNVGNFERTVSNVTFNTINSTTSIVANSGYLDRSCTHNTVVAPGSTHNLSVTLNTLPGITQLFEAYIDYNNNGVFTDPGELVASGSTTQTNTIIQTDVTIPMTAVTGSLLRLRVYGEAGSLSANKRACLTNLHIGDVEDYGVHVSNILASVSISADPVGPVSHGTPVTFTPAPVNGGGAPVYNWFVNGSGVGAGATYSNSTLLNGDVVHCEMVSDLEEVIGSPAQSDPIVMAVTGPPISDFFSEQIICAGTSVAFTDASLHLPDAWSWSFPGGAPASSDLQSPSVTYNNPGIYAVTLTGSNGLGTGTTMTKSGYITVYASPPLACSPTRTNSPVSGIGIHQVKLNGIDHATPWNDAVMNNYTCSQFTILEPATEYPISVIVGPANPQWVRVYIDYDQNGFFDGPGELVFAPANGVGIRSGVFTTPATPPYGAMVRMRVISDFHNTTPGYCTTLSYGQVEDYGIIFTDPDPQPDCHGDLGGIAYEDDCEICVGGNTGLTPCSICVVPPACVDVNSAAYADVIAQQPYCCDEEWYGSCQYYYSLASSSCGEITCIAPPSCVDVNSAAYAEVIANEPMCCYLGWDLWCEQAYAFLNNSCLVEPCEGVICPPEQYCQNGICELITCPVVPPPCVDTQSTAYGQVIAIFEHCCYGEWDLWCQIEYDAQSTSCTTQQGCPVDPPECVNTAGAGYQQVIMEMPWCCSDSWDPMCQSYYDMVSTTCTNEPCTVVPPACVDAQSAAYATVTENDIYCCLGDWDGQCQSAYNALNNSCTSDPCDGVSPVVSADHTLPVCAGGTLQLLAATNGDTYSWTGPNGFHKQ